MKKLLSLLLAVFMLLSLAACGGDKESSSKDDRENVKKETSSENGEPDGEKYGDEHGDLAKEAEAELPDYILEAIRAYYGLEIGEELTDRQVASVEKLRIEQIMIVGTDEHYADAAINGSELYGVGVFSGAYIKKDRFENSYEDRIDELLNDDDLDLNNVYDLNTFLRFYVLRDPDDTDLSEKEKEEMLKDFSVVKTAGAVYVLDEAAYVSEIRRLLKIYDLFSDVEYIVNSATLDLSCLEVLPNLEKVECENYFEAENSPVKVTYTECDNYSGHSKGGENITWSVDGDVLNINGSGEMWNLVDKNGKIFSSAPWVSTHHRVETVNIEDGITTICAGAFTEFVRLKQINIPDSVETIGDEAFYNCALETVTIPDSVKSIGSNAFGNCSNLVTVTIPDSVEEIGYGAFNICYVLTDIYFGGTKAEWEAFDIGVYGSTDSVTVVHCSDGDIE